MEEHSIESSAIWTYRYRFRMTLWIGMSGIIGLGMVGRLVAQRLEPFDLHVIACDPFATPDEGRRIGADLMTLEEVFRRCDVVSLHAPWLKETEGMITGDEEVHHDEVHQEE